MTESKAFAKKSNSRTASTWTSAGVSGLDLYVKTDDGKWRWLAVGRPFDAMAPTGLDENVIPGSEFVSMMTS